jgi:hypothetical protein
MTEGIKFRFATALFVMFLISGYYSYQEFRYLLGGRTVDATVDQVEMRSEQVHRRRRFTSRTRHYQQVMVHFSNGEAVSESRTFRLPTYQPVHPEQTLAIQYLPGQSDMIRLSGSTNWLSVLFFVGSLVAFAGMIVWAGMEANRPYGNARVDADRAVRANQPRKKKRVLKPLKPLED